MYYKLDPKKVKIKIGKMIKRFYQISKKKSSGDTYTEKLIEVAKFIKDKETEKILQHLLMIYKIDTGSRDIALLANYFDYLYEKVGDRFAEVYDKDNWNNICYHMEESETLT